MARLNMNERRLVEVCLIKKRTQLVKKFQQTETLRLEKEQLQNKLAQVRRDLERSLRNQAEAEVIHEDNANELGEVRAAMAAMRAVMQGYGGGRGIHAAMAGSSARYASRSLLDPKETEFLNYYVSFIFIA